MGYLSFIEIFFYGSWPVFSLTFLKDAFKGCKQNEANFKIKETERGEIKS
jgi:hypothetical protein